MNNASVNDGSVEYVNTHGIKINGLMNVNWSHSVHYLIYKVTNLINGMYYYGQHATTDPRDDYMGSGIMLDNAKNKYGLQNFVKTILFDFATREEMNQKERELLPESGLYHSNPMCYNLATGGCGGNLGPEVCSKISAAVSGSKNGMFGKKLSPASLEKISAKLLGHPSYNHGGYRHTEDAKRRISEKHVGMHQTEESKQKLREARACQTNVVLDGAKGKHWYHDPTTGSETMMNPGKAPDGWLPGRLPQPTSGMRYCNNGVVDLLLAPDVPIPEGFVPGRHTTPSCTPERNAKISAKLKGRQKSDVHKAKIREALLGRHWYNNGTVNVQARECPEGFVPGRMRGIV